MSDLTKKTIESLQKELSEKQLELREFRFGGAGSRARDVRKGRMIRRDIARILTEINARAIALKANTQ